MATEMFFIVWHCDPWQLLLTLWVLGSSRCRGFLIVFCLLQVAPHAAQAPPKVSCQWQISRSATCRGFGSGRRVYVLRTAGRRSTTVPRTPTLFSRLLTRPSSISPLSPGLPPSFSPPSPSHGAPSPRFPVYPPSPVVGRRPTIARPIMGEPRDS